MLNKLLPIYKWDKDTLIAVILSLKSNLPIICLEYKTFILKSDFDKTIKEMEECFNYHGFNIKL
jgi:hypothetical protein